MPAQVVDNLCHGWHKSLMSFACGSAGGQLGAHCLAQVIDGLRLVAVQELTVLHSIKLVKVMLQGAGALSGALLHTVHSQGS